jgi:hypothetical protein
MQSLVSRIALAFALASGCWASVSCGSNADSPNDGGAGGSFDDSPVGCLMTAPTACPSPPVTYTAKVQPILQARCVSRCHNGATADPNFPDASIWELTDYKHVTDWQDLLRPAMVNCTMPPSDASVPMTVDERRVILEWIKCGTPQ